MEFVSACNHGGGDDAALPVHVLYSHLNVALGLHEAVHVADVHGSRGDNGYHSRPRPLNSVARSVAIHTKGHSEDTAAAQNEGNSEASAQTMGNSDVVAAAPMSKGNTEAAAAALHEVNSGISSSFGLVEVYESPGSSLDPNFGRFESLVSVSSHFAKIIISSLAESVASSAP